MTSVKSVLSSICSGMWQLAADPDNIGKKEAWHIHMPDHVVEGSVPCYSTEVVDASPVVWYYNCFSTPEIEKDQCAYIEFSGVNYFCEVWINGVFCGSHEGFEETFEYDVTGILSDDGNMLAIRVVCPIKEWDAQGRSIDGMYHYETPLYCAFYPLIQEAPRLLLKPKVRIEDIFASPDCGNGEICYEITMVNQTGEPAEIELTLSLHPARRYGLLDAAAQKILLEPGSSTYSFTLSAGVPQLWSHYTPNLYQTDILCRWLDISDARLWDMRSVRSGFREFSVDDEGFFQLNGKRCLVKSAMIIAMWQEFPEEKLMLERFYKDIAAIKSCGFNMIRFISTAATPMQLDICDELGMMVHEEHRGAWQVKATHRTEKRFFEQTREIIRRDRNHASLVIFGMLNETHCQDTFDIAVRALKPLRALAPDLLFLLSSGRWDGELKYASASNPGSSRWDAWMGEENEESDVKIPVDRLTGYLPGMGDIHYYPAIPYDRNVSDEIQNMGQIGRAIFLSENGCGSLGNCISIARYVEGLGQENNYYYKKKFAWQSNAFERIWKEYKLDTVYPTPEEVIRDTMRLASRQRRLIFDMIRSNPKIAGYGMTAFKCAGGSGIWEMSGECKSGMPEAMDAGWAPLRWCLFVHPSHVYAGDPFDIAVYLANEGVLKAGCYPATVRIHGGGKIVWERKIQVEIAPDQQGNYPLAVPVLKEKVCPEMNAGSYTLSAVLEHGGHALDEVKTFFVSDKREFPRIEKRVAAINLPEETEKLLKACGAQLVDWSEGETANLILVGSLEESALVDSLASRAMCGAHVIYLDARAVADKTTVRLPFENKGYLFSKRDWLFHKDSVLMPGVMAEGLLHSTIMDPEYYVHLLSFDMFLGLSVPDELHVASFICGGGLSIYGDKATCGGFSLGTYKHGKGSITLNSLNILAQTGNPAADRLLINLCHI